MRLWKRLMDFFRTKKRSHRPFVLDNPSVYWMGGGWGDAINWFGEQPGKKVVGWKHRRPVVGDVLLSRDEDGGVKKYVFTQVELMKDPRDMFFADVEYVGDGNVEECNHA